MQTNHIDVKKIRQEIAAKVRADSQATGKLTPIACFAEPPLSLKEEDLETVLASFTEKDDLPDIKILKDEEKGCSYLYATPHICEAYAGTLLLAAKNDSCRLIAETVRRESVLYPRPVCFPVFALPPYNLDLELQDQYLGEIKRNSEMGDIKWFKASTGVLYLYSELYISQEHARGLAEWAEVDQFENV